MESVLVRRPRLPDQINQAATLIPASVDKNNSQGNSTSTKQVTVTKQMLEDNFLMFCIVVLGMTICEFHVMWARFQLSRKRSLVLAPRDHGKSMLLTIAFIVWRIIKNPNIRILIASNSAGMAENFLAAVKSHLERNQTLRALFGDYTGSVWNQSTVVVSQRTAVGLKEPTVSTVGVFGSLVSGHYDIIICDDLVDFENSRTQAQRDKIWDWFWMVLYPTLETSEIDTSKDGSLHMCGTRYHSDDLYGRLIGEVEKYKPAAMAGAYIRDSAIIGADASALWADRKSLERLIQIRRDVGSVIFALQYQNDASLMMGRIFQPEYFNNYYSVFPEDFKGLVAGYDLAVSQKTESDYFSEAVIGFDKRKNIYLVDIWKKRLTAPQQFETIKASHERHKYLRAGVESVAYQEALSQFLKENTNVPVRSVKRTKDKTTRAYKIQPLFENSKFFMPRDRKFYDFVDEMTLFPDADHDDMFDALETAIEMVYGANNFEFFFLD